MFKSHFVFRFISSPRPLCHLQFSAHVRNTNGICWLLYLSNYQHKKWGEREFGSILLSSMIKLWALASKNFSSCFIRRFVFISLVDEIQLSNCKRMESLQKINQSVKCWVAIRWSEKCRIVTHTHTHTSDTTAYMKNRYGLALIFIVISFDSNSIIFHRFLALKHGFIILCTSNVCMHILMVVSSVRSLLHVYCGTKCLWAELWKFNSHIW